MFRRRQHNAGHQIILSSSVSLATMIQLILDKDHYMKEEERELSFLHLGPLLCSQ